MALMYAGSRAVASRPKECASRASKGHTSYKQGLADLMAIEDAMTSFNEGGSYLSPVLQRLGPKIFEVDSQDRKLILRTLNISSTFSTVYN